MKRASMLAAFVLAVVGAAAPAWATYFAETAVQTHRGTSGTDPDGLSGNGVFEANRRDSRERRPRSTSTSSTTFGSAASPSGRSRRSPTRT